MAQFTQPRWEVKEGAQGSGGKAKGLLDSLPHDVVLSGHPSWIDQGGVELGGGLRLGEEVQVIYLLPPLGRGDLGVRLSLLICQGAGLPDSCRKCGAAHETLDHILNACTPNTGLVRE